MHKRKISWQIFPSFLIIIVISILFITWFSTNLLKNFYQHETILNLRSSAYLLENLILPHFAPLNKEKIDDLTKQISVKVLMRVTVIMPDGSVISDSDEDPAMMNNHKNRPEVKAALENRVGNSIRFSNTLKKEMVYVAVPLLINNEVAGVLRTSMPLVLVQKSLQEVYIKIVFAGMLIAFLTAIISYRISQGISGPLEQRNKEQEVVLSNMKEGIIAVNSTEKIIRLNKSAADMLNINLEKTEGRLIKEAIQNIEFLLFIEEALINNKPMEDIIVLSNNKERFIQIYSTPIYNQGRERAGTLIVLNDITQIKKLENIRRDFVANVSHELRTPITSIKGFVETLLDGNLKDRDETRSFLKIINKHANRLNAIIEDLLSISRLEQGLDKSSLSLENGPLINIIKGAVQLNERKAKLKKIKIKYNCPEDIKAVLSPSLVEQAIINLVDNAINYSNEDSTIEIEGKEFLDKVVIKVSDQGCGIPEEHLTRIFERFYRVDKARSRKLGGTGLGLAIVKHIAQTHGGHVNVESKVGKGTTFYIHLPK